MKIRDALWLWVGIVFAQGASDGLLMALSQHARFPEPWAILPTYMSLALVPAVPFYVFGKIWCQILPTNELRRNHLLLIAAGMAYVIGLELSLNLTAPYKNILCIFIAYGFPLLAWPLLSKKAENR